MVKPTIHIASFNAENFYLLLDAQYTREKLEKIDDKTYLQMNSSIYNSNKDRTKIAEIARIIQTEDFDLIGLVEIGGMETLAAFNRMYLENRYDCYLDEVNSRRGIFVGALVKKGRFPNATAHNMDVKFSRNLLRLDLGQEGGFLRIFVVHLKSQLGGDHGIEQRIKEVEHLSTLVRSHKCIVMGDFNGILIRGESQFEYDSFLQLPFTDVLEAVGIPAELRRTHYYFDSEPHFHQLDYIFCSNDITIESARVIEGEIPINREQRNKLPSDHLFITATIIPPARAAQSAQNTHLAPRAARRASRQVASDTSRAAKRRATQHVAARTSRAASRRDEPASAASRRAGVTSHLKTAPIKAGLARRFIARVKKLFFS